MIPRLLPLSVALVLASAALSGCTPQPAPTPTPTGFATEDEAFAAAEETYRAYVDALNQVDLSDPETFEPVYAWTTGEANAEARKSYTRMNADGWTISGESQVALIQPSKELSIEPLLVATAVCLDVSAIRGVDRDGASVVSPDRNDVQPMLITYDRAASSTGLLIASIEGREGDPLCASE